MNLTKLLLELRSEREKLDQVIATLERLAAVRPDVERATPPRISETAPAPNDSGEPARTRQQFSGTFGAVPAGTDPPARFSYRLDCISGTIGDFTEQAAEPATTAETRHRQNREAGNVSKARAAGKGEHRA